MSDAEQIVIRSTRTRRRIEEMCRNGAGVPSAFNDGTVWAESYTRGAIIYHTGYRLTFNAMSENGNITGTWQTVFVETLNEDRHLVAVTSASKRQPDIGVVHNFTIRSNGSVTGLPAEMVRHIFGWSY